MFFWDSPRAVKPSPLSKAGTLLSPQKIPRPRQQSVPSPPPLSPQEPLIYFLSRQVRLLWIFPITKITERASFATGPAHRASHFRGSSTLERASELCSFLRLSETGSVFFKPAPKARCGWPPARRHCLDAHFPRFSETVGRGHEGRGEGQKCPSKARPAATAPWEGKNPNSSLPFPKTVTWDRDASAW